MRFEMVDHAGNRLVGRVAFGLGVEKDTPKIEISGS